MTYRAMLVEDEKHLLAYMREQLSAYPDFQICGSFDVPEEALSTFGELRPDVVFLDIQLPRISGLALAERLLEIKPDVKIVFLTAYDQYALDAFRVEAIDYILKPIGTEEIERVLQRLGKLLPRPKQSLSPVIRCLGTFEVTDRNGIAVKWPTKKSEELFAYLWAHRGQQLNKWSLVELLWPDQPEERGMHSLYTAVYRMKLVLQQLAVSIEVERHSTAYRLIADERISDLEELYWLAAKPDRVETHSLCAAELFLSYRQPLFGGRGYAWSALLDIAADQEMDKLGAILLKNCHSRGDAEQARAIQGMMAARHHEAE